MPYTIPNGAIIAITMKGTLASQTILNTFTYKTSFIEPPTDGDFELGLLLTEFTTNIALPYQTIYPIQSQEFTWNEVWAQMISPTRYVRRTLGVAQNGGQETLPYPPNVAACISRRGDEAGRGRVGRIEIAGLPQDTAVNGIWIPGTITDLNTVATAMRQAISTGFEDNEYLPVVFKRSAPATSPRLLTATPQVTARVMRRRTVGVGQ